RDAGRGPDRARRRLRTRLSAAAGGAPLRVDGAAEEDSEDARPAPGVVADVADETPTPPSPPAPPKPAAAPAKPAAPPKPKGPAPVDASDRPLVANVSNAVPGAVVGATEFVGQTTIEVAAEKLVDACRHLKESESFAYLVDLTAVDWKDRVPRFDVVLWLHSFTRGNERLRLRVKVGETCP